jgi:hypothetical protein
VLNYINIMPWRHTAPPFLILSLDGGERSASLATLYSVPNGYEFGWARESAWTLWRTTALQGIEPGLSKS